MYYTIRAFLFTSLLFWFLQVTGQGVRINEIMSSNGSTLADEDGDFSDWIELYNCGDTAVSLEGWGLSDNPGNPFKWVFPEVVLAPREYLLVWASGKDYRPVPGKWVNGIRREVYPGISGTTVESLTGHKSYPNQPGSRQLIKQYFEAPVDEANNYGQRMHGYIKAPVTGSYVFYLSSDDNGELWISNDTTTVKMHLIAEVPSWTLPREWDKYPAQRSERIPLLKGRYYYIMALAKEGTGGDNLAVGWDWPDGTSEHPINGRHVFWKEGELHTSFSISAGGETLTLTNPRGEKVSEMPAMSLRADISLGFSASSELLFFTLPTPGRENSTTGFREILDPPVFSHGGGFYDQPFDLTLSTTAAGATIVYSLDGSFPSGNNLAGASYQYKNQYRESPGSSAGPFLSRSYRTNLYTSPLRITDRSNSANQISMISSTFNASPWYAPSKPIPKAVVVKARTEKEGALSSEVVSHTFFIRNGGLNPHPLPVVSISAQENDLFDFYHGIYVAGSDFENWRNYNPSGTANGGVDANYHRSGDDYEFRGSIEFFDTSGNRFLGQDMGYRIHGNWSNAQPFKSLRIYARKEYGKSTLDYPFFKSRNYTSYKRIILRNSGNDNSYTLFRDAAMHEMVSHMNFETQAYQPSVLFINGEYWGIHNIRERIDKYFLSAKFGMNIDQLDILENNMSIDEGDSQHYAETLNYITRNGVKSDENYDWVTRRIDPGSFTDYMIAQIFMVNTDWPGNNIKYWRLQTPDYLPDAGAGRDGRWRWILYDTDFAFGIYRSDEYSYDMMYFTTQTDGPSWPNPPWSTLLFRELLANKTFRTGFINRFCDQLNTAFQPAVVLGIIDGMKSAIEPEMTQQVQRWKIPSSVNSWNNYVAVMQNFASRRPAYARNHLRNYFGLSGEYLLTVNISGKGEGHVVVNTIPLTGETRGVAADPYPWQGRYFRNLPLRLEAIPSQGYEFARWESGNYKSESRILNLQPAGDTYVTAVFREEGTTGIHETLISANGGEVPEGSVFPNPFKESAVFRLETAWGGEISVALADMQGRVVRQVYQGYVPAGSFSCPVDGTGLAPGVYFLTGETPEGIFRRKVVRIQP